MLFSLQQSPAPCRTRCDPSGVRTAARILTEIVGKDFASAGQLASYAGLAPRDLAIRDIHPRRPPRPERQQDPQESPIPLRLRRTERSSVEGLIRPETSRRQTPQSGSHRSRPSPLRHPLRHAQRRHLLRTPATLSRLTKPIEAPPRCQPRSPMTPGPDVSPSSFWSLLDRVSRVVGK